MKQIYFPPPANIADLDGTQNIDHITCLERTVCSNYFCCGDQHCDLHALLEHIEEDHILARAPNGKRVYPRDGLRTVPAVSSSSCSSSSASSSTMSSPASSVPSSPSSTPTSPRLRRPFASECKSSLMMGVKPVYTPFTPSLPVDPSDPYLDADEIVMLDMDMYGVEYPPSDFFLDIGPPALDARQRESTFLRSDQDNDEEMLDDYIQPIAAIPKHIQKEIDGRSPKLSVNTSIDAGAGAPPAAVAGPSSVPTSSLKAKSPKSRASSASNHLSRRREKLYRCPTPRCTKSYLNPNGLKYHVEKGTCKLDNEVASPATTAAPSPVEGEEPPVPDPAPSLNKPSSMHSPPADILSAETNPGISRIYATPSSSVSADSSPVLNEDPQSQAATATTTMPSASPGTYYRLHANATESVSPVPVSPPAPMATHAPMQIIPVTVPLLYHQYLQVPYRATATPGSGAGGGLVSPNVQTMNSGAAQH